jgi:hypothetical protein
MISSKTSRICQRNMPVRTETKGDFTPWAEINGKNEVVLSAVN